MTPPMTPREKVRQIIDDALNSAIPEPWEVANHATDRILTALASGSGDHAELARLAEAIGPVEWHPGHLCRDDHPCDCAYVFDEGHAGAIATVHVSNGLRISEGGNDAPEPELAKLHQAFIAAANPATVLALLAENAALTELYELTGRQCEGWKTRATEAERKLAEARLNYAGALSDIDSLLTVLIRRVNGEKDLASAAEWVRLNYPLEAEKIISKEAERE